jgi:hypothetical protein
MRRFRIPLTVLLGILLLVDLIVGYRLWESGWPANIVLTSPREDVEQVQVLRVPFTGTDWLILILLISTHALIVYLVWKAWRSAQVRL